MGPGNTEAASQARHAWVVFLLLMLIPLKEEK